MINQIHPLLSKRSRARLLDVNLSTVYLKPKPISSEDITLMNEIRDIYETPIFTDLNTPKWILTNKFYFHLIT